MTMQPHTNGYPPRPTSTVVDLILDQLEAWGVQRVYGVVGDAILPLVSAMAERNAPRFIPTRHEEAAVFMAKADAILTGGLGVCTATSGPGTAHFVNGLADAYTDSAPVFAITGQVESRHIGAVYKQSFDQQMLVGGVTEVSAELSNPAAAPGVLTRLMRTALARKTAVHLSVPKDFWRQTISDAHVHPYPPYLETPARSTEDVIRGALHHMHRAMRPAIVAGVGARSAVGDVLKLAETMRAPVITSLGSLGQIPGSHHLNMGSIGEGGSEHAGRILMEADLVLRLGTTWWPQQYTPMHTQMIDINVRPEHIGVNTPTAFGIAGPLEEVIPRLLADAPGWPRPEWEARIAAVRSDWDNALAREAQADTGHTNGGIHPAFLARALTWAMPRDAVISLDVGDHVLWFNRHFKGTGRQDILFSGYWRTMGFGLPAAIGAKLSQPHRPSVAVIGDGGFGMVMMEWMTAVRYGLPITVVLFNNQSLAMEEHGMQREGMAISGVRLNNPDFSRFAGEFGGRAYYVDRYEQLEGVLTEAMQPTGPVLVNVHVQRIPLPASTPAAIDPRRDSGKVRV